MNSSTAPRTIGIVIRTLNESELIGTCLETLRDQHCDGELDILVVDSGSTDSTIDIARSWGARVVELDPADFDYSTALNLGIEQVRGEIVASLSAHTVPIGHHWLETMLAPFSDPAIAGVASRQVPWPNAPWREVHRLAQQFGEAPRAYSHGDTEEIVFSNAASLIRRSAWFDHRFVLPAAEDLDWARRVIAAGWRIFYEPRASVYHSHRETPRAQARRLIDLSRAATPAGARNRRRTIREAGGLVVRDARKILVLDESLSRKLSYLGELLRVGFYYVADFSSAGTTAEHLRGDPAQADRTRSSGL